MNKKKILVISDSPLVPSGVGTQTKYMIEALLATGKYSFFCLAGAMKHKDYRVMTVDPYGEDWKIKPVDGYGDQNLIRAILRDFRPDVVWFMTDPRFYIWLWEIENEIRKNVPMVYYHVWDNYPYPTFNKEYYESNDLICTISKVTDDIVKNVSPDVKSIRIPHAVDTEIFKNKKQDPETNKFRKMVTGEENKDKLVFFWNNRNARRKQSGTLIFWFKEYLDIVGHDKACLVMHTEPHDQAGQDLQAIINRLELNRNQVLLSTKKLSPKSLASLYSAADCTINISDAEGFGLSTLESLACETPIIVNMTGGLQEQVTDGKEWFGFGIKPCSRAIIGSQDVPWIYEDRISKEDFIEVMVKFTNFTAEQRKKIGQKARSHVLQNYGFDSFCKQWQDTIEALIDEHGSWEERKNYKSWKLEEIK
tara:strand:- start:6775 stop:8037 length:1263 start_codon:yes stop_codon:yes gene_type:complete